PIGASGTGITLLTRRLEVRKRSGTAAGTRKRKKPGRRSRGCARLAFIYLLTNDYRVVARGNYSARSPTIAARAGQRAPLITPAFSAGVCRRPRAWPSIVPSRYSPSKSELLPAGRATP